MSDSVNDTSINDKSKRLDDSVQEEMEIQNNTTFRTIEIKDCDFVKESDWLKSSQIAFWLQEYRKQFPNVLGLDHPSLYSFRDFKPIFDSNRLFIQVVLVNNCHWICLSNYLCKSVSEINIYDSLNTFTKQEKLNTLKAYFKMLFPDKQNIIVNVKNVQKQENGNDCGLFSLAFTQMICLNKDPTQLKFYSKHFRQHFNACLKENSISEFPSVYKKNETHDKKNYYISLNDIL